MASLRAIPDTRPPDGGNEDSRLAALHALALLDTEPEAAFDALVALAAELLGCPTALLTLVDRDRQWVKARIGSDLTQTPRDIAFCDQTVRDDRLTVIADATADPRFNANRLVTGPPGIRFYAGTPIHVRGTGGTRHAIGALCVIDRAPRELTTRGRDALAHMATLAESLIAARQTTRSALDLAVASGQQAAALARSDRIFRQAERLAGVGSWRMALSHDALEWSDGVRRIHDLPPDHVPQITEAMDFYPPHARAMLKEAVDKMIAEHTPFDLELDFITATGRRRRVRSLGELEFEGGVPVAMFGVFRDVTDEHRVAEALRHMAETDELTGTANRAAFNRHLEAAMGRSRATGSPLALVMVDLDGFKAINDTLGHLAGDDVLKAVGRRLVEPWLRGSFAARLGGDEFALVIEEPALVATLDHVVRTLEDVLCQPVSANGMTIAAAGTVGATILDPDIRAPRDFIHATDVKLYAAKRARVGERRRGDRRAA